MGANKANANHGFYRGEIYYITLTGKNPDDSTIKGGRPAIIVSNDMNNALEGHVEIVYMTRKIDQYFNLPTNVVINATGQKSIAICGQVNTVAKNRIGRYLAQCSDIEMERIDAALILSIALEKDKLARIVSKMVDQWKEEIEKCAPSEEIGMTTDDEENRLLDGNKHKGRGKSSVENSEAYIKVCTERDVYKNLYHELLQKQS